MEKDIFEKILDEHQELSSLPQTLYEVLRLSRDSDTSAGDISAVLLRDPAMTAKVLRMANSPYFGAGRQISSVSQAVTTLGVRAVTALALSASVYDLTDRSGAAVDRIRFWRHSLCVALGARGIAEKIGHDCPEEAFVAGLLHDVGLLVLERMFPEKFARLWQQAESGENLHDLEENVWGTTHARIGQFLLEQWHVPEIICNAIGRYPVESVENETEADSRLAQVVGLANDIAPYTIVKKRPAHMISLDRVATLCGNLGLDNGQLGAIRETLLARTLQETRFLEIEVGATDALLAEANRMLYHQYIALERVLHENRPTLHEGAREQLERSALEALRTITATLNHYINNAVGTILGRAQLMQIDIRKGRLADNPDAAMRSMEVIVNGVKTIRSVLEELNNLSAFKTTVYYDDTYIIDIEKKIKEKIEQIEDVTPVVG